MRHRLFHSSKIYALALSLSLLLSCNTSSAPSATNTESAAQSANVSKSSASSDTVKGFSVPLPDIRDTQAGSFNYKKPLHRKLKNPLKAEEFGVEVSDFEYTGGFDLDGDGAENRQIASHVELAGFGKHQVMMNTEDFPIMDNRNDEFVITDKKTRSSLFVSTDQDLFNFTLSYESTYSGGPEIDGELSVETNPDATWSVNGENASTPIEAAQLMLDHPIVKNTSIHTIAFLVATTRAAANRNKLEYEELPLSKIDKGILADVGNLVDENALVAFDDHELFENQNIDEIGADEFFDDEIEFSDDDDFSDEEFSDEGDLEDFESASHNESAGIVFGERTLSPAVCDDTANDYGNPTPVLEALLTLMKAERQAS